jgi:hypothetical protein
MNEVLHMPAVPKATRNRPPKLDPDALERLPNDLVRFLGYSVERAAAGGAFSVSAILDTLTPAKTASDSELTPGQKATYNCLCDAMRQLPLDRRRVVLLHDFAEMPLNEIAKALDCSVGAAKVRLQRGRRQLAEICRAECECDTGPEGTLLCSPKVSSRRSTDTALAAKPARKERR